MKLDKKNLKTKIFSLLGETASPMTVKTVMNKLKIKKFYRADVKNALRGLVREGEIEKSRNKYFIEKEEGGTLTGRVDLKADFGFLRVDDGEDVFLGRKTIENLLPGDTVEVYLKESRKGGTEGVLKKLVKRTAAPVMCRVKKIGNRYFACPANKGQPLIKIQRTSFRIKNNDLILVSIGADKENLNGEVISHVYGGEDINMYKQFILNKHEIKQKFPAIVTEEAEKASRAAGDCSKRENLKGRTVITIDPADAKDFDDAISLEKAGKGYLLGVHIADVSDYIREESELDREAAVRGFSTYLPGEVIPMLPEKLSNGVCSLREKEDRKAFSIFMNIDTGGNITGYEIKETVIRSVKRLSYEDAEDILRGRKKKVSSGIKEMIFLAEELKEILKNKLKAGGSIDFTLGEPVLAYDDKGEIRVIERKETLT